MSYYSEYDFSPKSHFVTGILCILLGYLGIHRFYVGKYISGIVYFLLTVLIVPGFFIHFIVGLVLIVLVFFLVATDFFQIYWNLFEDSKGLKISPEGSTAVAEKEPILPLVFSTFITGGLLIASCFNISFLGFAIISAIITLICLLKEVKFLSKKR